MNRIETSRLEDLRARAELADLEIETLRLAELATIDTKRLTAGQLVTLANVVEAIRVLFDIPPATTANTEIYAPPSRAERRSYPPSYGDAPNPYGLTTEQRDKAEEDRARAELVEAFKALLTGKIPDKAEIPTVAGPIRYADIPKDETGNVPDSWLDENCTCDEHEAKRIGADTETAKVSGDNAVADDSIARGLYL